MPFHTSRASLGRAALTLASASIKRPPRVFGLAFATGLAATGFAVGLAAGLALAVGLAFFAFTALAVLANYASTSALSAFADTALGLPLLIKIIFNLRFANKRCPPASSMMGACRRRRVSFPRHLKLVSSTG